MKIFNTEEILTDFEKHINDRIPWSLLRLGDGGLKFIHSILFNDADQLSEIVKKEGIPENKAHDILDLWATSANICDYIDTSEVYFTDRFWDRVRKGKQPMHEETLEKMHNWKKLHVLSKIKNTSYCNPEINFLSCLDFLDRSLIEILYRKKICFITSYDREEVLEKVTVGKRIDVINIVKNDEDHYHNSFNEVIINIENNAKNYDVWLVAAGELGRIYTGLIKHKGGISFDIGSTIDYWCNNVIPLRLVWFLRPSQEHALKLSLTEEGEKYRKYL